MSYMSCQTVQKFVSAYLDRMLVGEEREMVARHLGRCRECAALAERTAHLRNMVHSLPLPVPPRSLSSKLRVIASHERGHRLARLNWAARRREWAARASLFINNLMRPLALPFAGGLLSALCLFAMLMPSLLFQFRYRDDVPTAFYTEASLSRISEFTFPDGEIVVDLTIDEQGRISDYSLPHGKADDGLRAQLANLVVFSKGNPATLFGYPTSGKVRVTFRRSHFVVRG